MEKWKKNLF